MEHPHPHLMLNLTAVYSILSISFVCSVASLTSLPKGSHLSVEKHDSDVLVSPDGTFSCGFHEVGTNAFSFSIWFCSLPNKTIVWTANRDSPVNGKLSKMAFRGDGSLALIDADGSVAWSTSTHSSNDVDGAMLLDSGNLVVNDVRGKILWQSFDSPTDTLLPGQPITRNTRLVSSNSTSSLSSGYYIMCYGSDNILRLIYDGPDISSIYWPNPDLNIWENGRTRYNSSRYGVLDSMGQFVSSDSWLTINASDMGSSSIRRRLKLDHDGNLRLYSLHGTTGAWSVTWQALSSLCNVHGFCGRNGICTYTPTPKCSCPVGYHMADPSNWKKGCSPDFKRIGCDVGAANATWKSKFVEIPKADFYGYDLHYSVGVSLEACRKICEKDCSCEGFVYRKKHVDGSCFAKVSLFNGYSSPGFPGRLYIKLPVEVDTSNAQLSVHDLSCDNSLAKSDSSTSSLGGVIGGSRRSVSQFWLYWYVTVSVFGFLEILFILIGRWFLYSERTIPYSEERGYRLISPNFQKFSYVELKKATGNFKEQLGKGGSGEVYKGVLSDKRVIAVKRLPNMGRGEDEFHVELSMIGKIYHMNLVRMWGFCLESSRRLLVYEFVERGSLDKALFHADVPLEWKTRFGIALGIAKGLAYLHHECLEWVIHCDIKPENILLDENYEPKIADFGLVQLTQRDGSALKLSTVKGTKGYMAPEWTSNVPITAKVDVYSYGVILLELLRGAQISSGIFKGGEILLDMRGLICELREKMVIGGEYSAVEGFMDPRLEGEYNMRQVKVLLKVAVSCVELDRNKRPTMDSVVHTLLSSQVE